MSPSDPRLSGNQVRQLIRNLQASDKNSLLLEQLGQIADLIDPDTHEAIVGAIYDKLFADRDQTQANLALNRLVKATNHLLETSKPGISLKLTGALKSGRARRAIFKGTLPVHTPDPAQLGGLQRSDPVFQVPQAVLPQPKVILVTTVNEIETTALLTAFSPQKPVMLQYGDRQYANLGLCGGYQLIHVRSAMGSTAPGASFDRLDKAIVDIQSKHPSGIALVVAVGVAFGIQGSKNERAMGDILVSEAIQDYENQRVNKTDGNVTPRGDKEKAPADWVARFRDVITLISHTNGQDKEQEKDHWRAHLGLILSGDKLIDNINFRKDLEAHFPTAIGGEMEGKGLFTAASRNKVDWIVVKGICDWGDGHKNAATKDADQARAASNSVELLQLVLEPDRMCQKLVENSSATISIRTVIGKGRSEKSIHQTAANAFSGHPDLDRIPGAPLDNRGILFSWVADNQVRSTPEQNRVDALAHLEAWLSREEAAPVFVLLGEYGMGKTVTCQRLYRKLREDYQNLPGRQVFYFDLRDLTGLKKNVPTLDGILAECVARKWDDPVDISLLREAAKSEAGALFIFDGLDEVLVHYSEADGLVFIRELMKILPTKGAEKSSSRTRVLMSCRSHLFRDLRTERERFTGQDRQGEPLAGYECMTLLPFEPAQIHDYLSMTLTSRKEDVEAFMSLLDEVHDLKEVAQRPYTLSLLSDILPSIVTRQKTQRILGVTIYREVVLRWLERDAGKQILVVEDKLHLAAELAARLWRSGQRSLPALDLESFMLDWIDKEPSRRRRYAHASGDVLGEELRNSSFLVRVDRISENETQSSFRFAHTSMQEYFLAEYLLATAFDNQPAGWSMPLVSRETLSFLGQLLSEDGPHLLGRQTAMRNLQAWGASYLAQASEQRLGYALFAFHAHFPSPALAGSDLSQAKLANWRISGTVNKPLIMNRVKFKSAQLYDAEFEYVDLSESDFSNADLSRTRLNECKLHRASFMDSNLQAGLIRHCEGVNLPDAAQKPTGEPVFKVDCPRSRLSDLPHSVCQNNFQFGRLASKLGHRGSVRAICFSPDGARILSGSDDNTLKLWDAHSLALLHTFEGHSIAVTSVAFSPDGARILSGSYDETLKLWDAHSLALLHTFEGHSSGVTSVAFSPDGARILSGSHDNTLKLWDAQSLALLHTFEGHSIAVTSVAFSPDGARILSGSYDNTLKLWDAHSLALLHTFEGHSSGVTSVAFSPDGARILSGSDDNTLKLWDAHSLALLHTFEGHSSAVASVAFSPDGARILSGSYDRTLKLWDAHSLALLHTFEGHSSGVASVAFSPDGARILSGSYDETLKLWDAHSLALLHTFEGHSSGVTTFAFSPDGARILSGSDDNTLKLWDAHSLALLHTFEGHSSGVTSVAFSPDGARILSGSHDNTLKLWDAQSLALLHTFEGHSSGVASVAFSPNGARILSGSYDNTLKLWDAHSLALLHTFEGHSSGVTSVAFSPDGARILSGSDDNTLKLWDAHSLALLHTFEGHSSGVTSFAFSPDGARILSGSHDNTLKLWDAHSLALLHTFEGHSHFVSSVAFSPDGARILSGSYDETLKLWNAHSLALLHTFEGHSSGVASVAFSPDGARILSGSYDNIFKLWELHTQKIQASCTFWRLDTSFARGGDGTKDEGYISFAPARGVSNENDKVIAWGGNAWKHFGWSLPKTEIPAEWRGPGPEGLQIIPLELMTGVPEPTEQRN